MRSSSGRSTRHGRRQFGVRKRQRRSAAGAAIAVASVLIGLSLAGCGGSVSAATPTVTVFPIPGARVASPQTQIAFRGMPIGQVGKVVVTGSRSGVHTGRFESDSDGDGGSFLPAKPFVPGEVVTVQTSLHILGARPRERSTSRSRRRRDRFRRPRCRPPAECRGTC